MSIYERKTKPVECIRTSSLSPLPHLHAEWEMIVCLDGEVAFVNGDRHEHAAAGDILLIPPNHLHYYFTAGGRFILMIFTPDMLPDKTELLLTSRPTNSVISFRDDPMLAQTVRAFDGAIDTDDAFIAVGLYIGYLNLLWHYGAELFAFRGYDFHRMDTVRQVMNYCAEHFREPLPLTAVAQTLGISVSGISHLFSKEIGLNYSSYVNWLRISEACRLLRHSPRTITEIAYQTGFSSLRSFNRVFVDFLHVTPGQYRRSSAP